MGIFKPTLIDSDSYSKCQGNEAEGESHRERLSGMGSIWSKQQSGLRTKAEEETPKRDSRLEIGQTSNGRQLASNSPDATIDFYAQYLVVNEQISRNVVCYKPMVNTLENLTAA